jgi:hypothetical protein
MAKLANSLVNMLELSTADKIIDLASQGLTLHQIATLLKLDRRRVSEAIQTWMAEVHTELLDKVETLHTVELQRLDYMYSKVAPYAFPRIDPEFPEVEIPPDRGMLQLLLNIIKEKREWIKQLQEAERKARERGTISFDSFEITMHGHNPLYERARVEIASEAEAKSSAEPSAAADMPVTDLYTSSKAQSLLAETEKEIKRIGSYYPDKRTGADDDD